MSKYTKEDIIRLVRENDVSFIRLQFTDILGTLKNVAITPSQLEKALDNKCMFDGSSIEGFVRIEESDMYLYPDYDSFVIIPWRPQQDRVARLICDVYKPDGTPFEGDPRYVLKKTIQRAADMGLSFNVGPECEFFLFHTDDTGHATTETYDEAGYFDLGGTENGENARRDMVLALEEMGFEIEASHHEVAVAQHEIDFKYSDALDAADHIMTFKMAVKAIARQHGMCATFMPKPIFGINGSGMHTNMSLFTKDGKNAFYDPDDSIGLSKMAYSFIAGIMKHMRSMTAITNPLVNSYKRLVPGYEAPCYIAWTASNRSALIRVPASRGMGTRVELRCPDPACNSYLELAVLLAAGLDGIEQGMQPVDAVSENIFHMTLDEREARGIESLPGNLHEAIREMRDSQFVKDVLGDHVFTKYLEAKRAEWDAFRTVVTQWELDEYLEKY